MGLYFHLPVALSWNYTLRGRLRAEVEGIIEEQEGRVEVVTRQEAQIANITHRIWKIKEDDVVAHRLNADLATSKLNALYR